jgi:hypothetical protein
MGLSQPVRGIALPLPFISLLTENKVCANRGKFTYIVRFEIFTAMTMNNTVFLDVAPCRYSSFVDCFYPEDGGDTFLRNVKYLHGATSHKTVFFTYIIYIHHLFSIQW